MKKVLLSAAAVLLTITGLSAQKSKWNDSDQMSIRIAGYEVLLESEDSNDGSLDLKRNRRWNWRESSRYAGHIGILELGFNGLREQVRAYSLYPDSEDGFMDVNVGKSFDITLNLATFSASLTPSGSMGFTTGIGVALNSYTLGTPSAFIKEDGMIRPVEVNHHLKKSKLNNFALHIPVALEFNPTKSFFFSVGGYADLMLSSRLKWKSPKEKLHSPYTNFLHAGLSARIGFRHVYLFGNYALTSLFKNDRAPVVAPWTFGIGFGL